ncbi:MULTISPECIES: dihydroxyacetone kinase family protein [unclassified Cyanobium]|uniref:dihydroxyacetone kinase family protein n=1 Tax=unclassified Cyanobium TaxID=2627006 RepID=UPI0020CE11F5|nr:MULTISPECIES: dihydroxyacetone kinase family protein [unclassified Cyanobium]MCP9776400.1 dihydroxyacetone kinase family protein [Cyanobium sp. Tous-M-B4]MCP9877497.1 dihydroxyacetone kinase family protein [Cyanobium sp. A2C-AMD]
MSYLPTDASDFASKAIDGFVAAHPRHVQRIDGGVIRIAPIPCGQVGVVVGGGSGHYPAFAGLVGRGLAAGAACGNIFASPSAGQVMRVGLAVERGAGLLLSFGNYAGDVLHFTLGAERLRRQGIDVRIVTVTDDIASAPIDQPELRRGIAGGLVVFKVAGAAAEAGLPLDEVERLARKANGRIRSLGVAFSGCTLPGASQPLFDVPSGRMAIGMGLHGEPGLSEGPLTDADSLAALLVERLLAERPADVPEDQQRLVVLLNGLGSFKYEELFVLFGAVNQELLARGVVLADCECGELVTSLDMAGVSLSLCWLDAELEGFWSAPADSAAYRRGALGPIPAADPVAELESKQQTSVSKTATQDSTEFTAAQNALLGRFEAVEKALEQRVEELGALDAVAGDGDHGLGMLRGIRGARQSAIHACTRGCSTGEVLMEAGEAWSDHGGGTSGALWGGALLAAGNSLARSSEIGAKEIAAAFVSALQAVVALGQAAPGDKTMVDALQPYCLKLRSELEAGVALDQALQNAAANCLLAAQATAEMLPKLGRARPHGSRSLGHPDPGAMSLAYCLIAATQAQPAT